MSPEECRRMPADLQSMLEAQLRNLSNEDIGRVGYKEFGESQQVLTVPLPGGKVWLNHLVESRPNTCPGTGEVDWYDEHHQYVLQKPMTVEGRHIRLLSEGEWGRGGPVAELYHEIESRYEAHREKQVQDAIRELTKEA